MSHLKTLYSRMPEFLGGEPHHINWAKIPQKHPVIDFIHLPEDGPKSLPKVQASETSFAETESEKKIREDRREHVKKAFLRSWGVYKEYAWGHDEFSSISGFKDHFGGWGATLIDAMDTLLIMGLDDEFKDGVEFCKTVDFSVSHMEKLNVFETTIRYLGGLLAAHELAEGKDLGVLLQKAKELGEMLYHAFDTFNRMPIARWRWEL
jgi:mannosyl-oligosaccharide alpha-1,2-mannosidase